MIPRSTDQDVAVRAAEIIRGAGYLTIATATPETGPWAAQLQYAWFTRPLRLVVGSRVAARHCRDIAATGVAAATVSTLPGSAHGLDGLQMAGDCHALSGTELESAVASFYQQMFSDTSDAQAQALSLSQLEGHGSQRLLELRPHALWILDLDLWDSERVSARVSVDMVALEGALDQPQGAKHC